MSFQWPGQVGLRRSEEHPTASGLEKDDAWGPQDQVAGREVCIHNHPDQGHIPEHLVGVDDGRGPVVRKDRILPEGHLALEDTPEEDLDLDPSSQEDRHALDPSDHLCHLVEGLLDDQVHMALRVHNLLALDSHLSLAEGRNLAVRLFGEPYCHPSTGFAVVDLKESASHLHPARTAQIGGEDCHIHPGLRID